MMDMSLLPYYLMFIGMLAAEMLVIDPRDDDDDSTTPPAPDYPGYDAAKYDQEISGTAQSDVLSYATDDARNTAYFLGAGDDQIDATAGNEYIYGDLGRDLIDARGGNDLVYGGAGQDTIDGGTGLDTLKGGEGDDLLNGNKGNDLLQGEAGNDRLVGGSGADTLAGGDGNDTLSGFLATDPSETTIESDQLSGGAGADQILMGQSDVAQGGSEGDLFVMDATGATGSNPAIITDYTAADGDQLQVYYDQTAYATPPELTTALNSDGNATIVSLNGTAVARISGTELVGTDQVALVTELPT